MDEDPDMHEVSARSFIDYCKSVFGWSDLSRDVIMDVGCGEAWNCGKALVQKFPHVGAIIGIDRNPKVVRNFKLKSETPIECVFADIEQRESLRNYEGKMSKVVSTHTFHQLAEKQQAFRNVFLLLKTGGEAAILFVVKSLVHEWLTELIKKPKWKNAFKRQYLEDMYRSGFGADQYRELAENIGFRVVKCREEKIVIPYPCDEVCKEALYRMCKEDFNIPSVLLEEFKEECLQVLLKLSERDVEGRPCYRSTELSLLLTKPEQDLAPKKQIDRVFEAMLF